MEFRIIGAKLFSDYWRAADKYSQVHDTAGKRVSKITYPTLFRRSAFEVRFREKEHEFPLYIKRGRRGGRQSGRGTTDEARCHYCAEGSEAASDDGANSVRFRKAFTVAIGDPTTATDGDGEKKIFGRVYTHHTCRVINL